VVSAVAEPEHGRQCGGLVVAPAGATMGLAYPLLVEENGNLVSIEERADWIIGRPRWP